MTARKLDEQYIKRPWSSEEDDTLRRVFDEAWPKVCAARVYCAEPAGTLDHVVPLSRGGEHAVHNLVPACRACNCSKKDKLLSEWSGPRKLRGV